MIGLGSDKKAKIRLVAVLMDFERVFQENIFIRYENTVHGQYLPVNIDAWLMT